MTQLRPLPKNHNLPLTYTEETSTVNKAADLASAEAFGGDHDAVIIHDCGMVKAEL